MNRIKIWLKDRLNGLIDNILWVVALAAIPSVWFILNVLSTTIRVNIIQSSVPFWMWVTCYYNYCNFHFCFTLQIG
jgi:hypothetical protein